jgi:hypothetical protein
MKPKLATADAIDLVIAGGRIQRIEAIEISVLPFQDFVLPGWNRITIRFAA